MVQHSVWDRNIHKSYFLPAILGICRMILNLTNLKKKNIIIVYILFSFPLESWIPLSNLESIRGSLMRHTWLKLGSLAQKQQTSVHSLLPKDNLFKNIW